MRGEFSTGHNHGAGRALGQHHSEQFVHCVVGYLHRVPVLALHDDVVVALVQLEVDAAIESTAQRRRSDVLHAIALVAKIVCQQRFEFCRLQPRQPVIETLAILPVSHGTP